MVLVAGLALAGCTDERSGNPTSTGASSSAAATPPATTTPSTATLPAYGAPAVTSPLDAAAYLKDPCRALSSGQIAELGVSPNGGAEDAPLGKACGWRNSQTGANVYLQFAEDDPEGLSSVYRAHNEGKFAYFVPYADIDGFPAVAAAPDDDRQHGGCVIHVGVSDKLTFQLGTVQSHDKVGTVQPCTVAVRVAKMMVQTMKAGA